MIKKGTPIVCQYCQVKVYDIAQDVDPYSSIQFDHFSDVGFGTPKEGEPVVCPNCGKELVTSLQSIYKVVVLTEATRYMRKALIISVFGLTAGVLGLLLGIYNLFYLLGSKQPNFKFWMLWLAGVGLTGLSSQLRRWSQRYGGLAAEKRREAE